MASIDCYTSVSLEGGTLWAGLESGARVPVECTVPAHGVLRLRIGPAREDRGPMLNDIARRPATLAATADGVVITGPGVEAVWGDDGQHFQMAGFRRFADPRASKAPVAAGRKLDERGRPVGWVETAFLAPDAAIYGGGESYQGPNLRGRRRLLRNTEENRAAGRPDAYLNVPLLWSDAGWGVFVHTAAVVDCDLGAAHSECARFAFDGAELDVFLITGDAPTILRRYLNLTGMPRSLPDWAFGVWMSRSSYFSEGEVTEVVEDLRAAGCPVDVVHVDEWLSEPVLHTATWSTGVDRDRFPAGWVRRLGERGIRVSLWLNPYVKKGSALARRLESDGLLLRASDGSVAATADNPETLPIDFTDPRAAAWWRERLMDVLREEGNAAVLADFGEEIPDDAGLSDGQRGATFENAYGLVYQEAVWRAGHQVRGDDFVSLCRSGTAGSQRIPGHWAGDLPSTWSGMVSSLRACLSMSLSGFAVVTHDAGGYWTPDSYRHAVELRNTMTPDAVRADVEPELYARWAQWAAFSPIMRFHGVGRREPTAYPEPARTAAIEACRLRKRLQPYVIAAADDATRTGTPLMRPMVLAYPGDRAARDADLQYLFGPDILVAPILEPGGRRKLWAPPGRWRPLCGTQPLNGPRWVDVDCGLDEFPAYARADR
ncbi:glycoside hydrolase family 31 protein [Nonomuraea terrae]|uniref:glycoside hydrolase family 31 protein n=1 Tax=Nonomuraea terrae TaxID=2530383 RepID=UPI0037978B5B